mmetsp:Transcript_15766/g.32375  ORF Transcript_15766/g.32375 Transcript_15766/m.32375 type:complete len:225 (+) Transcript_15766:73-747(+)
MSPLRKLIPFLAVMLVVSFFPTSLAAPEDYVEPTEEDMEEEIIIRDDGTSTEERPKLPARPPFTLHDYNSELHAWIVPLDEYHTLKLLIETGYDRAVAMGHMNPETGKMTAGGIIEMINYCLNPDLQEISEEEEEIIRSSVAEMRSNEGLEDDGMALNVAYLNKGGPYKHIKKLLIRLREGRRHSASRRLSGGVGFGELWLHENEVDAMIEMPEGETGRRMLEM